MATVMTKEQILSDIRRVAKQRGGRVSLDAFLAATGIKEHQLLGTFWATWNEAVAEAGLPTSRFARPKTEESSIIEPFADLVERLKKWPTQNELLLERRRDGSFPSLKVIRRLSQAPAFASKLAAYCTDRETLSTAARCATAWWTHSHSRVRVHDAVGTSAQDRSYRIAGSPPPRSSA